MSGSSSTITATDPGSIDPRISPTLSWPLKLLALIGIVIAVLAVGGGSALAGSPDAWYAALVRPPLAPPNWIFGPVWTLLYIMMGISLWLLMLAPAGRQRTTAIGLFLLQLLLNFAWTPIFFGLHRTDLAAIEIVLLLLALLATIGAAARVSRPSALLLVPYAAWVSFATYLSIGFWWLNRS